MKHLKPLRSSTVALNQRGYSDIRLWPCYMVYSASIVLLAPLVGMLLAFTAVTIPALLIAIRVAKPAEPRQAAYANYLNTASLITLSESVAMLPLEPTVIPSALQTTTQATSSGRHTRILAAGLQLLHTRRIAPVSHG